MKEHNPLDWAEKADGDLAMAARALHGKRKYTDAACYHAQQSAEKYIKALLIANSVDFPKSHDLISLNTLCILNGILTAFDEDMLDFLTGFAVRVRYPGEAPTLEEAREAIKIAKTVRKFCRKYLGLK